MSQPSETNHPKLSRGDTAGRADKGKRKRERNKKKRKLSGSKCLKRFQSVKDQDIKAVIARGIHLYPFRTEKLSPVTPMVLRKWESR